MRLALCALRLAKLALSEIKIRTAECQWWYGGLRMSNLLQTGKGLIWRHCI